MSKRIRCFFLSSRRRHTRSKRDWSSDVCSSDLRRHRPLAGRRANRTTLLSLTPSKRAARSEERRVGKECRSRRSAHHEKKNQEVKATAGDIIIQGRLGRPHAHLQDPV